MPDGRVVPDRDPAAVTEARETVRLAFVAALQHLPARQRAVLILCEVLRWKAAEVAELLETSVASVNSALQRARATLEASDATPSTTSPSVDAADAELLARYVEAFERYDMDALTALIHEDAQQSMPPFDLWLTGRDDIFTWWFGPGNGCRGSRVIPTVAANGSPAFGQYKPTRRRRLRAGGRSRCSSSRTAGSSSSRSSSTSRRCSRSSASRSGTRRSAADRSSPARGHCVRHRDLARQARLPGYLASLDRLRCGRRSVAKHIRRGQADADAPSASRWADAPGARCFGIASQCLSLSACSHARAAAATTL